MYRRILVAYDGSEGLRRALKAGLQLAEIGRSELRALCVEERLPHYAATVGEMEEMRAERDHYFGGLQSWVLDLRREHGLHTARRSGPARPPG